MGPKVDVWLVVGTRRWARVVAGELCALLPNGIAIDMQGDPLDAGLRQWISDRGLGGRIRVVEAPSMCPPGSNGIALIVDSAYRHGRSIEAALASGYNVVSEKPVGLSLRETQSLAEQARALNLSIFCTNTYLFADYLTVFRTKWLDGRDITGVRIAWHDPAAEERYGAAKSYDSAVPLIIDVLPHIANIIIVILGERAIAAASIEVLRGGSEILIGYRCEGLRIDVDLARNADRRRRRIDCSGPGMSVALDFTNEPGIVEDGSLPPMPVDPDWQQKPRPIAGMLTSAKRFFENATPDARLGMAAAEFGSLLIDAVIETYADRQVAFLESRIEHEGFDPELRYAKKESRSLAERALPYLSPQSPLRRIASARAPAATNPNQGNHYG